MKLFLALALVVASLALIPVDPVSARGAGVSGQACLGQQSGALRADSQDGMENWHSTTWGVRCPIRLEGATKYGTSRDLTWARANVRDRNGSGGVWCRVEARTLTGGAYFSATRATGSSYKGTTQLTWTSNPINGGASTPALATVALYCALPKSTGSGRSSVESVAVGY